MAKRYYWLKLNKDFYKDPIKRRIRKMAGGERYLNIYLEMMLLSIETEGTLKFEGYEDSFAQELAMKLEENIDDILPALVLFQKYGLMQSSQYGASTEEFFLPEASANIGSETDSAIRMRKKREQDSANKNSLLNMSVTSASHPCHIVTVEKLPQPVDNFLSEKSENSPPVDNFSGKNCASSQSDSKSSQCDNKTSQSDENSQKRHIVQKSDIDIDIDIYNKPYHIVNSKYIHRQNDEKSTNFPTNKVSQKLAGGELVDGMVGLKDEGTFEEFWCFYPRKQGDLKLIREQWDSLLEAGVHPSDLVSAAQRYARQILEQGTEARWIKMPQNFLQQKLWGKYIPKAWKFCPICKGDLYVEEVREDGYRCMTECECTVRYKKLLAEGD